MISKRDRKMFPTSILIVLIFIRHTVIATYKTDLTPKWSGTIQNQNQQSIHLLQATRPPELQLAHRQHRHHHNAKSYISNRETRAKLKQNESKDWTMVPTKKPSENHYSDVIFSNRVNMHNFEASSTNVRTEQNPRLFWLHNNRQSDQLIQQRKEHSMKVLKRPTVLEKAAKIGYIYQEKIVHEESGIRNKNRYNKDYENNNKNEEYNSQIRNYQKKFFEKTAGNHYIDPVKISHDYQDYKNKDEYDEYYDYNLYGGDNKEERDETETEGDGEIPDYMLDESDTRGEWHENAKKQDLDQNSEEYLNDDFNPLDNEQNQNISLTERKWKVLGTPDAVRDQFLKHKVEENIERLRAEGRCRWPRPKVIPVIEASDLLRPHCAILHRCADDTGCCDDGKTCVAKSTTFVDLYFYITPFDNKSKSSIDYRTFENHTECHCIQRSRFRRTIKQHHAITFEKNTPYKKNCRCPSYFRAIMDGTLCACDCSLGNQKCYALKEGKALFPYEDQRCIAENFCQKPSCLYGNYNIHSGRCGRLSRTSL